MAFETFESDRESLVQGAGKVKSTRTDVSGDLSKLRNVIDDLVAHGWHGTASQGFQQVMASWEMAPWPTPAAPNSGRASAFSRTRFR